MSNNHIEAKRSEIMFMPLKIEDLDLLFNWFQAPIVKKWYAKDLDFTKEDLLKKYSPRISGQENIPKKWMHYTRFFGRQSHLNTKFLCVLPSLLPNLL